jgi:hypothetical protein
MDKVKEHLDKIIAGLIILACVVAVAARLLPGSGRAVNSAVVEQAISNVDKAILENRATPQTFPDWVDFMAKEMTDTEPPVSETRVAWAFYPQPPFEGIIIERLEVVEIPGVVGKCSIALAGGPWVGKALVKFSFGAEDKLWTTRALQVWRKSAADKDWPAEPLLTIKARSDAASKSTLPPGVVALDGRAFELPVEDLKPREPYEYRVRTAAVFPPPEQVIILDGKKYKVVGRIGATRALALDALLGGEAWASEFSEVLKLELPGDVQIRFNSTFTDLESGKEFANFEVRRYKPNAAEAKEGWITRLAQRVDLNQDIKVTRVRITVPAGVKPKVEFMDMDAEATLVKLGLEPITTKVRITKQVKDPATGELKTVIEEVDGPVKNVPVATIKDKRTGQVSKLLKTMDGGDWHPKGLTVPPAVIERPVPDKKEKPPAGGPAKTPAPEVILPKVELPAVPAPPPGNEPGVYEIRGLKVDIKKPVPPDASPELRQAYEEARKKFEEEQRIKEAGALR